MAKQLFVARVLAMSMTVNCVSQSRLRGTRNSTWVVKQSTTTGAREMNHPIEIEHAFNVINSASGALIHSLNLGAEILAEMNAAGGKFKWDTRFASDFRADGIGAINDCDSTTDPDCSAWTFLQKDLLPIAFNYPFDRNMQHAVALMVDRKKVEHMIRRMYVVDGDSWSRSPGGVHFDDSYLNRFNKSGQTPYVCVPTPPPNASSNTHYDVFFNEATQRFEALVGENGEYWPQHFQDVGLNYSYTMAKQCYFEYGSWEAWRGALSAFYARAKEQVSEGRVGTEDNAPDGRLYLENELNLQINVAEDMGSLGEGILGVTVQDNTCASQLWLYDDRDSFCSSIYNGTEMQVIEEGREAACRLSNQLSHQHRRLVPVIQARYLSNALVETYAWNEFSSTGAYAEKYMEYYDCCARYSRLHDYSCKQ